MRPNKPIRYIISAISVAVMITGAIAGAMVGAAPAQAQGTDEAREYKCFAERADQSQFVFYYYDQVGLPSRFSDADTIAQARIPNSLRASLSLIHECLLRELDFTDPVANRLEIQQPQ
jgi:hypothetical protein